MYRNDQGTQLTMEKEMEKVNVVIMGRNFPVRITAKEKAYLDEEVKKINEILRSFQQKYSNKDQQDCLSMALLTYAMQLRANKENNPNNFVNNELDRLEQLLLNH